MSTNPVNNNSDEQQFEQQLQAYINNMNAELQAADDLINALTQAGEVEKMDQSKIDHLLEDRSFLRQLGYSQGQISSLEKATPSQLSQVMHVITNDLNLHHIVNRKNIDRAKSVLSLIQDEKGEESIVQQKVDALEAIDPNISGALTSLEQLIQNSVSNLADDSRSDDLDQINKQINQIVTQLCEVILDQIQVDLAQAGMKEFGNNPNFSGALMQFASIALQAEFKEQGALLNIQNEVISENTTWQQQYSNAKADASTHHWYDDLGRFFSLGLAHCGPDLTKDHAQMQTAMDMIAFLQQVEEIISPMIVPLNPGMEEINIELGELKKKLQEFLSGDCSFQDLKDAMIAALSLMVGIIAETSKDASMFDKEMGQGSEAASQISMNDSLAQLKVVESALEYAKVMNVLMKVVQYAGMALIAVFNPGFAVAFMTIIDIILNATGVMNKLQDAIAKKIDSNHHDGGIWSAVIVGLIEAVGTAGGSAGIEALISKVVIQTVMQAVTKTVAETVQNAVKAAVETAVKAAGKAGDKAAEKVAEEVVQKTVDQAVENAEKKVAVAFLNKTIVQLIEALLKGTLKESMDVAAKETAEIAATACEQIAEQAAKDGLSNSGQQIAEIAEKSATQGVQKALNITEKQASELGSSFLNSTTAGKAIVGGVTTEISSIGQTQLINEISAARQKKDKEDLSEVRQIMFQIINIILQLIGTFGSALVGLGGIGISDFVSKLGLFSNIGDQVASAVASGGQAGAAFEQAGAVKAIAKDQAGMDLMQFILQQLQKDGNQERAQYAKQMALFAKSNLQLSMHFNDAEAAVAEAMAVTAV